MGKNKMNGCTRRDLTIVPITKQTRLVIACDSCGSIGIKDGDVFKLPPRYTAKFTARVALTEVMCSGAMPVTIINGAACEMKPTGEDIILGIQDELKNAEITDIILTGSTEENFATCMTALAITVIGTVTDNELKFKPAVRGDKLILLGTPKVGSGVDLDDRGFYTEIRQLLTVAEVREIVPVGSKGISYEAETLASLNSMKFKPFITGIDYFKSAGPATCLIVLCAETVTKYILQLCPTGVVIGEIQ